MENILARIEELTINHDKISPKLIKEKDVKLGLRNQDGTGVIVGLTTKGRVVGYHKLDDNTVKPVDGKLYYCGYDTDKIVEYAEKNNAFMFDEVTYLLLAGELPVRQDLLNFSNELSKRRALSKAERRIIMEEVQNENQMYGLHSVISHMSRCDTNPDSIDIRDVSRQCINLIAKFPTIVAYNYNVMRFRNGDDLKMVRVRQDLSTAENFLYMLKGEIPDPYEALLFDIALVLHAEHGGGNNSTFTVRSVSSSGANTYMAIAAGIASLSGYLHGGANESVMNMMKDLKKNVKDWSSESAIKAYLEKVLDKKAGDGTGKLYGFGHAVYTLSDPRAIIFKRHAKKYAKMKDALEEYNLYELVEKVALELLMNRKKGLVISPNVDYYSGFVYNLMGIPKALYTPMFAMARVVGWSAHRLEQIIQGKIMRPAYIAPTTTVQEYIPIENR